MLSTLRLRGTLRVLAIVPMVAGAATLLFGSDIIPGRSDPGPSVESELRFYGVWWMGAGLFLWSLAPDVERRGRELRVFAALLALGAVGRVIAIADEGAPDWQFLVLLGVELVVAAVLVLWQRRVSEP